MNKDFDLQECIFHLLAKASKAGTKHWKTQMADLKLTATQVKTLSFLHYYGESSAGELSERMAIDNATLTGVLDRLETAGLVSRHSNTKDARSVVIQLTNKSTSLAETAYQRTPELNQQFLQKLSLEEQQLLRTLLVKIG